MQNKLVGIGGNPHKFDELFYEAIQDEIANDRNKGRNARGEVYPTNRAGRRAEAKRNKVDRKERQKRARMT